MPNLARSALALLSAVAAALAASGPAHAEVRDLAPVANDAPLSAHGGWVLWSELQPDGGWHLVGWHRGERVSWPVPARTVPFDVDVGTDARGRPVATYSRCAVDPVVPPAPGQVPGYISPNGLPRQSLARGCGPRALDLVSGRERTLAIPRPRGASDTTPSMWRGDVSFARMPAGGTVAQVLLWRHRGGRLVRLAHGTVPASCTFRGGCDGAVRRGEVQQLDLGSEGVAFVWDVVAPSVIGTGEGWELRLDDLRTGASRGYDSGYQSGACGARYPVSPTVVGRDVWFAELRWICDVPHTSYVHGGPGGRRGLLEVGPPLMWQVTVDGDMAYSIRGPRPEGTSQDPPCVGSAGPCRLVAEPLPDVPATGRPVGGPFI